MKLCPRLLKVGMSNQGKSKKCCNQVGDVLPAAHPLAGLPARAVQVNAPVGQEIIELNRELAATEQKKKDLEARKKTLVEQQRQTGL